MSNGFDGSSAFKKNSPPIQQPMREYTVGAPDESDFYDQTRQTISNEDAEKRMMAARKEKLQNMDKISAGAKQRIEILANIGRLTKDIELGGSVFSIRTLKSKENREATLLAFDSVSQIETSFEIRRQMLARSIYQIDNKDLEMVLGNDSLEMRLNFVDDLEDIIVYRLYTEFEKLKEEIKAKYSISSEKEAKEVAEDLKK